MRQTNGSCFIDAVELALGCPADEIATLYNALVPLSKPDETGYHPSIVNILILEKYGTGLSEIDCVPVGEDGEPVDPNGNCVRLINDWFNSPGFRCVIQGPRIDNGEEHAVAFRDGTFIDPANGIAFDQPPIQIRSVWTLSVPPRQTQGDGSVVPTETE